jgi:glycosyltransferase involved in cell wall biosynthesis
MAQPEIAVLVSSFERPGHLRRVLTSIAAQRGIGGALEVVVTDDGSRDDTPRLVRRFAASVGFPVRFVTHLHDGFQLARCRNEGVQASSAPYLLFLDGDCIIPPDHLRTHLDRRCPGYVMAGYPIHLNEAISEQVSETEVRDATYLGRVSWRKKLAMRWRHVRALGYSLIGHSTRPKLLGGNLGIARSDYDRVNGYDENFRGWGCEDDDLRVRLRISGVKVASIAWWTNTYHLWHPKTPSAPATWRAGANVEYLQRPLRLTRPLEGMAKRRLQDLQIKIAGHSPANEVLNKLLPLWCRVALATQRDWTEQPEIEIAFAGCGGQFSNHCHCRLLIVPPGQVTTRDQLWHADLIFSDDHVPGVPSARLYRLNQLDITLQEQLGAFQATVATPRHATAAPSNRLYIPAAA